MAQVIQKNLNIGSEKEEFLRPPVVVLLGHVDHGKTTLLDSIAGSNFAPSEFGEITQNIRACQAKTKFGKITFIDTPGHRYFSNFRNYGVKFADLALLVISATEGVKTQTIESVKLATDFKLPIICVISKIDLPQADVSKVEKQLAEVGVLTESEGGNVPVVKVSATEKRGIDDLAEIILLMAEMFQLKANLKAKAKGVILESFLDEKSGPVSFVIMRDGILTKGTKVQANGVMGKVRAIFNQEGKLIDRVYPSQPAKILGIPELTQAGCELEEENGEKVFSHPEILSRRPTLSDREKAKNKLRIILKTDTVGSKEAILSNLPNGVQVIDSGVGLVTAADCEKAKSLGAKIFGFNVGTTYDAKLFLKNNKNLFFQSSLIYELIEEIAKTAASHYQKEKEFSGLAKIVKIFDVKGLKIAGCKVTEGQFVLGGKVKIFREDSEISQTQIVSIKQFAKNVQKVAAGSECGIGFSNSVDIQVGDVLKFVS